MSEAIKKYLSVFEKSGLRQAQIINNNIEYTFDRGKLSEKVLFDKEAELLKQNDREAWEIARNNNTIVSYKKYLSDFSGGKFEEIAKQKLERLNSQEKKWHELKNSNDPGLLFNYLKEFPDGKYKKEARTRYKNLEADKKYWQKIKNGISISPYEKYLANFPQGIYLKEAEQNIKRIAEVETAKAKKNTTRQVKSVEQFEEYLKPYTKRSKKKLYVGVTIAVITVLSVVIFFQLRNTTLVEKKPEPVNKTVEMAKNLDKKDVAEIKPAKEKLVFDTIQKSDTTVTDPETGKIVQPKTREEPVENNRNNNTSIKTETLINKANKNNSEIDSITDISRTTNPRENEGNRKKTINEKKQNINREVVTEADRSKENKLAPQALKSVSYFFLDKTLKKKYFSLVSRVVLKTLPNNVKVRGQISIVLSVNQNGVPILESLHSGNLKITPETNRAYVENIIRAKFDRMKFPPPIDKEGNHIILKDWQIAYSAAYFRNVLSLSVGY